MKVDATQQILQLDGSPLKIDEEPVLAEGPDGKMKFVLVNGAPKMQGGIPLTFERAAREALMQDLEEDKGKPAGKKIERAELAARLYGEKLPVEISQTEADLIKDRVAGAWTGALVVYRVDSMLTKAKALAQEVEAKKKEEKLSGPKTNQAQGTVEAGRDRGAS